MATTVSRTAPAEQLAVTLLERLVRIPSVTGETAAAAESLVAWGRAHGLHAGITPTGAPWLSTHANPFDGTASRPHVLLYGHIDTVPGEIPVRVEAGADGPVLWGRGSVDAKAPLATFAAVVAEMAQAGPGGPTLTVIGAPDEEGDSDTAFWTIGNFVGQPPEAVIIGEPSGALACTLGYKGRVLVDVVVERPVVHGGYPEPSATDHLVGLLARYRTAVGADADLDGVAQGLFERVTMKIRNLRVDNDGLTETAHARLDIRIPPGVHPDVIVAPLRADSVAPEVHVRDALFGHVADRGTNLVRAFIDAIRAEGARPRLLRKTGTSDLNILAPAWTGTRFAVYGPGDSHLDHTPEERIRLAEVEQAVRVLRAVLSSVG